MDPLAVALVLIALGIGLLVAYLLWLISQRVEPPTPGPVQVGRSYTVISEATEEAINAGFAEWLDKSIQQDGGRCPTSDLVLDFVGKAHFSRPLLFGTKAQTGQVWGARISGRGKRLTQIVVDFMDEPWWTVDGQLRNWRIGELTLTSSQTNGTVGAQGILFVSNNDGNGANQDGTVDHLEFQGGWEYGLGFTGGAKANLNSEIALIGLACSNSSYYTNALFVTGLGGNAQEGQFLNYSFRDSKLEGSHGCYIKAIRGGNITVDGFASWLHTGNANGGRPAGTMIELPAGSRFDSEPILRLNGWRPEFRSTESRGIDCGWGSTGLVHVVALDDTSNAFKVDEFEGYRFTGTAQAVFDNCRLGTWVGVHNESAKVIVRDSRSCPGQGNTGSPRSDDAAMTPAEGYSGKPGILRYTGAKPSGSAVIKSAALV